MTWYWGETRWRCVDVHSRALKHGHSVPPEAVQWDTLLVAVGNTALHSRARHSRLSKVCGGCGVVFYPCVNNCHSGYILKCRLFSNPLNVFIVKTLLWMCGFGNQFIFYCVNKASRSMHEVLSSQAVSGLLPYTVYVHKVPFYTLSLNFLVCIPLWEQGENAASVQVTLYLWNGGVL